MHKYMHTNYIYNHMIMYYFIKIIFTIYIVFDIVRFGIT